MIAIIYTKKGDGGMSSTISEKNLSKADDIFELLGTLDEANSTLSLAVVYSDSDKLKNCISNIQKELISLCEEAAGGRKFVTEQKIAELEKIIDENYRVDADVTKLCCKDAASAALNMARATIRRAERAAVRLSENGRLSSVVIKYINRLSDVLYALANVK